MSRELTVLLLRDDGRAPRRVRVSLGRVVFAASLLCAIAALGLWLGWQIGTLTASL